MPPGATTGATCDLARVAVYSPERMGASVARVIGYQLLARFGFLPSVRLMRLKPGDIVVFQDEQHMLTSSGAEHVREQLLPIFPDNKVLVLDRGTKLSVISGTKRSVMEQM